MGRQNRNEKIMLNGTHANKLIDFVSKLLKLTHTERLNYFKSITKEEVDLISEIVLNFLHCNIKHDRKSFSLLKRMKKYLYLLASKKTAKTIKKKIIQSVKGLAILNILLPLTIDLFSS